MSDNNRSHDGYKERDRHYSNSVSMDEPPMSRLFVIFKNNTENEFRDNFGKYGTIEDLCLLKDRNTGESKGIAYIKFSKTSDAAMALESLHGKCIGSSDRPLKVLVASSRSDGSKKHTENEQEKYIRLFLVVSKSITQDELMKEFEKYGDIDSINILKDRVTGEPKGFAYIKYRRFYHAALAFENCPSKYKAVFAEPKSTVKNDVQSVHNRSEENLFSNNSSQSRDNMYGNFIKMNVASQPTQLEVVCSKAVNQDQLWRLFDIVPGLDYCQMIRESGPKNMEAVVVYTNPDAAMYARNKLHGLEYPPGERLIVRLTGFDFRSDYNLLDKRSNINNVACNVNLPPPAPLADINATCAKRCFIVLSSQLPPSVLKNVFCSFRNLIDVYLLPNKNCGYAKYANVQSADEAIAVLNGAEVCGVRLKVVEAKELREDGRKRMRRDE